MECVCVCYTIGSTLNTIKKCAENEHTSNAKQSTCFMEFILPSMNLKMWMNSMKQVYLIIMKGIEFRTWILSNSWTRSFQNLYPFVHYCSYQKGLQYNVHVVHCPPNCIPNTRWFQIFLTLKYCNGIATVSTIVGCEQWTFEPNSK